MVNIQGEKTETDIELKPGTQILGDNMIGWFDLMHAAIPPKAGESFKTHAFLPDKSISPVVTVHTRDWQEAVKIGDEFYKVFICDIPTFRTIHYVTTDGILVRIDKPGQKVQIELAE